MSQMPDLGPDETNEEQTSKKAETNFGADRRSSRPIDGRGPPRKRRKGLALTAGALLAALVAAGAVIVVLLSTTDASKRTNDDTSSAGAKRDDQFSSGETILVTYRVNGDEITHPVLAAVDDAS